MELFLFFAFLGVLLIFRFKYVEEMAGLRSQMKAEMHRLLAEQRQEFRQELRKSTAEKLDSILRQTEIPAETPTEPTSVLPETERKSLHAAPWKAPEEAERPPQYIPPCGSEAPWESSKHDFRSNFYSEKESEVSRGWNWFLYGREEIQPGENLEYITASNWLIRAGMLILVLGVGFFVNYSIEQGWFLPAYRILATTLLGGLMYLVGLRLWNTSLNLLGQALLAGSACVLYFSAFGASEMWELIPHWAGLAWGCGITAALVATAVERNSRLAAALGTLGACVTPYLFPILRHSVVGLSLYLLIIATGVLFLRRSKPWQIPAWLAFFGTVYLFGGLCVRENIEFRGFLTVASFLLLALFHAAAQRRLRNIPETCNIWDFLLAGVNALFFGGVFTCLAEFWRDVNLPQIQGLPSYAGNVFMGNVLLSLAAVGFLCAFLLLKAKKENQLFRVTNGGLVLFFLFILVAKNVEGRWFLPVSMLGFTLFHYIGLKLSSRTAALGVRILALFVAAVGVFYMCYVYACTFDTLFSASWHLYGARRTQPYLSPDTCLILIPERILLFVVPALCLGIMSFHAYKASLKADFSDSLDAAKVLGIAGLFFFMTNMTLETNLITGLYFPDWRLFAVSFLWTFVALSLLLVGIYRKISVLRCASAVLFVLAVLKIFFADISFLGPLARIFAFLILGFLILSGGVLYLKNAQQS